jgi:hypothetical protein
MGSCHQVKITDRESNARYPDAHRHDRADRGVCGRMVEPTRGAVTQVVG